MNNTTNDTNMTGNADNGAELRTKSGHGINQGEQPTREGWHWVKDDAGAWQAIWVEWTHDGTELLACVPSMEPGRSWLRPVARMRCVWGPRIADPDEAPPPMPAERPTPLRSRVEVTRYDCDMVERMSSGPHDDLWVTDKDACWLEDQLAEARAHLLSIVCDGYGCHEFFDLPEHGQAAVISQINSGIFDLQRDVQAARAKSDRLAERIAVLNHEIAEVKRQRDAAEERAARAEAALAALAATTVAEVEKLLGVKLVIDDTLPDGTAIVKGGGE